MFQGHALTGVLFTAGIAVGGAAAVWMAAAGVVGSLTGAVVARALRFDPTAWADGINGFNPALVGMATFFFFKPSAPAAGLFVGFAVAATLLAAAVRRYVPVPAYTMPFVVCTWVLHAAGVRLGLDPVAWPAPVTHGLEISEAVVEGLSEVMLIGGNPYTGLIFLAAIAVSNWRHAALAVLGAVVGAVLAVYHGDADDNVNLGLYGYNAVLVTIAVYLWRPSLLAPLLGAVVSVVITEFFPETGLPALTAPFVLAAWAVRAVGRAEQSFLPR
ncbi:Eukaryotic-type low-affinity urea transporter [Fimbriiglobus ruber]|uniref:Eukaryotic-type low-affinity urea transporter n=2 Tax=Fimbriiglobus ruber TaxID=1908690 RepID=A0A225DFK4_9BACT|nr:Eukaryotic-type low-affinity urea transporter [Fimbriiglobus ruber]